MRGSELSLVQVKVLNGRSEPELLEEISRQQAFFRVFPKGRFVASGVDDSRYFEVMSLHLSPDPKGESVALVRELAKDEDRSVRTHPHVVMKVDPRAERRSKTIHFRHADAEGHLTLILGDCTRRHTLAGYSLSSGAEGDGYREIIRYQNDFSYEISGPFLRIEMSQELSKACKDRKVIADGNRPNVAHFVWLHTLVHMILKALPIKLLGSQEDITECGDIEAPDRFYLCDAHHLGNGMVDSIFANFEELFGVSLELLEACNLCNGTGLQPWRTAQGSRACISCLQLKGCANGHLELGWVKEWSIVNE